VVWEGRSRKAPPYPDQRVLRNIGSGLPRQSGLMLAATLTLPHLLVSSEISLPTVKGAQFVREYLRRGGVEESNAVNAIITPMRVRSGCCARTAKGDGYRADAAYTTKCQLSGRPTDVGRVSETRPKKRSSIECLSAVLIFLVYLIEFEE
jgi:hypothetical protein